MITVVIRRSAFFAAMWWAIAEGRTPSLPLAALGVAAAVAVSLLVAREPEPQVRWLAAVRFVPFFAARSIAGGFAVMRRALDPTLPIAPGYLELDLRIEGGLPRALFLCFVNLMPGTISAAVEGDLATLHLVDTRSDLEPELRELEKRVAAMFAARG
jgi:multicomponent Na+:H+ antiporter subunit E